MFYNDPYWYNLLMMLSQLQHYYPSPTQQYQRSFSMPPTHSVSSPYYSHPTYPQHPQQFYHPTPPKTQHTFTEGKPAPAPTPTPTAKVKAKTKTGPKKSSVFRKKDSSPKWMKG